MELCPRNLESELQQERRRVADPNSALYLGWMAQILAGLRHIHDQGIMYGDLKPENLLLNEEKRLLYSDFGDARNMRDTRAWKGKSPHELPWGSPLYHAKPDVMKQDMTYASDMWMFAQTAVHVWLRQAPAKNPSSLPQDIPRYAQSPRSVFVKST